MNLGTCNKKFKNTSCKITSLGNLIGKTPIEVDEIMLEHNAYFNKCLSEDVSTAKALGIEYEGIVYKAPECICIAETRDYSFFGVPQHFILYHNGLIVDPLEEEPDWKNNCYNIASYRLFKPLPIMTPFVIPTWAKNSCLKAKRKGIITKDFDENIKAYRLSKILDDLGLLDGLPDKD